MKQLTERAEKLPVANKKRKRETSHEKETSGQDTGQGPQKKPKTEVFGGGHGEKGKGNLQGGLWGRGHKKESLFMETHGIRKFLRKQGEISAAIRGD